MSGSVKWRVFPDFLRTGVLFTRATGFLIIPLWLAAMGWLVAHDVWPGLVAQDPPTLKATEWLAREGSRAQLTIENQHGKIGTIWTTYRLDRIIERTDLIWIDRLPLDITPLRVEVDSLFTVKGVLDEFTLELDNADTHLKLHGERFHSDFSFTFESGPVFKSFKVPLVDGGIIAGAFNPFAQLTDLHVGQTWRMQVFNPVAALTGFGERFIPLLVSVTGEERIDTGVWAGNCLVVESDNAKAWVDIHGVARLQEMTLPVAGKIRIVRQTGFDEEGRTAARKKRLKRTRGQP